MTEQEHVFATWLWKELWCGEGPWPHIWRIAKDKLWW